LNAGALGRSSRRILFVSLLPVLALAGFVLPSGSFAEKPHDELKRIQKDIKIHNKKLESVKKVEQSVIEDLRKTTAELGEIERQLSAQRDKIKKIQRAMASLQEEIKTDSAALQRHKSHLKKRLRALRMFNLEQDTLLVLMSGEDIAQSLRTVRYLQDISSHDYQMIQRFKSELQVLTEKESVLKKLSAELKSEEKKLSRLEDSLKDKKKERETLLVNVRKEKGVYENMIRDLKESSSRLTSIIQESERRERELRKKKVPKTKPGTKEKQKEEEPLEDSEFLRMKGKLPWPVQGSVALQYGTQVDPLFNLPVFRSGIHIKAGAGTPVRAVHDGKVVFADDFKGYGQLVIVNHGGGYHSLYGNLAKIFLKNGAIIKDNQPVGEVGESGTLGTTGLYFEVRYRGKPLDPQQWLRR